MLTDNLKFDYVKTLKHGDRIYVLWEGVRTEAVFLQRGRKNLRVQIGDLKPLVTFSDVLIGDLET